MPRREPGATAPDVRDSRKSWTALPVMTSLSNWPAIPNHLVTYTLSSRSLVSRMKYAMWTCVCTLTRNITPAWQEKRLMLLRRKWFCNQNMVRPIYTMTSWFGSITDPLWGESTGDWWIPIAWTNVGLSSVKSSHIHLRIPQPSISLNITCLKPRSNLAWVVKLM